MNEKKIIITVGRQLGSGGYTVAKRLAEHFGCKLYDKELLNLAAKESGFSERFFEKTDERRRLFRAFPSLHMPLGTFNFQLSTFNYESLFLFQSDAIRKAAAEGSCVFVGRCADYVLREMKDKTDVFITADLSERIRRVSERHGCDAAAAEKIIRHKESARASYYNFYTGKRWGDSASYDLCLNSSLLGLDATADVIASFIEQRMAAKPDSQP